MLHLVEGGVVGASADEEALGGDLQERGDRQGILIRDRRAFNQRLRRLQVLYQDRPLLGRVALAARVRPQPVADGEGVETAQHGADGLDAGQRAERHVGSYRRRP